MEAEQERVSFTNNTDEPTGKYLHHAHTDYVHSSNCAETIEQILHAKEEVGYGETFAERWFTTNSTMNLWISLRPGMQRSVYKDSYESGKSVPEFF